MSELRLAAAGLLLLACVGRAPASVPALVSDGRYRMGTVLEIQLVGRSQDELRRRLEAAFEETAQLDVLLSRFEETSDVSRLNRAAGRGAVPVDPRTAAVLERAVDVAVLTRGGFDVTIGPLVELWTRAAERGRLPGAAELEGARSLVGAQRIGIDAEGRVALPTRGMSIDLGGIAKGFALDRLVPVLRADGVDAALLSFGQSSVWALGAPPGEKGWRLLLRGARDGFAGVLTLREQALSVSSSLGRWSEIGGRRYGHVIDPRTGRPLTRGLQAVVVSPSATLAEALSTALLILDKDEGLAIIEQQPGTEARLVDEAGEVSQSSDWQRVTLFEIFEQAELGL